LVEFSPLALLRRLTFMLPLLARLGMQLDAGLGALEGGAGVTPEALGAWVTEEAERSRRQWQPLRPGEQGETGK
jgi:hypothetical protein